MEPKNEYHSKMSPAENNRLDEDDFRSDATGALRRTESRRVITEAFAGPMYSASALHGKLIRLYVQASLVAVAISIFLVWCGLEFSGRQWIILCCGIALGVPTYVIPDILAINRHYRPLRRALNALDGNEVASDEILATGLVRALNLPFLSFMRISFLHGPLATLSIVLTLGFGNLFLDAGYQAWQFWFLIFSVLFFASPAHAVYEYFALSRQLVPAVDRIWAASTKRSWAWKSQVKSIRLRVKLFYLSVFSGAVPLAFLAWTTVYKADLALSAQGIDVGWDEMAPILRWAAGLVAVSISLVLVISYLLAVDATEGANSLVEAMARVRKGQLDVELRVAGTDEYADLFRGFNHMTAELRDEMRIHAITHELAGIMDLDTLISKIMNAATELLDAERSTLFLYDESSSELWSRFADGISSKEIRFPADSGIAGHVLSTGEVTNISDPYSDPRFNSEIDRSTGFKTRSVLCVPILHKRGTRIGVTQVLNKRGGSFSNADAARLQSFSAQISASLENARLFEDVVEMKNYSESILRSTSDGIMTLDVEGCIVTLNEAARRILHHDEASLTSMPATAFFGRDNTWVLESVKRVEDSGEADLIVDAVLEFASDNSSVNLRTTPLLDGHGESIGFLLAFEDVTSEKRLKTTMSRYMSKEVANQLLESGADALTGRNQVVSILFSDIREFTSFSETLGARETVAMLNEYFEIMVDIIHLRGGILDKYIGDAIMALFGAPFESPQDADNALDTANDMMRGLADLNIRRRGRGADPIAIGIGICTGEVVAGNIGSPKRFDYTAIGDHVNISARLESATKQYGVDILVSEFTVAALTGDHLLREIDLIRVKGKNRPVRVYEAMNHCSDADSPQFQRFLELYTLGLAAKRRRAWAEAINTFEQALKIRPRDKTTQIHRDRCRNYAESPPPEDWDGVWTMASK